MGWSPNVDYDRFPKQGHLVGKAVRVVFNFGTREVKGTILRDDVEGPRPLTVIQLEDGRVVLSTECQYSWSRT